MPQAPSRTDPVFFSAPAGSRVRVFTWLGFGLIAAFVAFNGLLAREMRAPPRQFWPMVLAPGIGLAVVIPVILHAWVRGYRLVAGELQVMRLGRINRFALAGLERAEFAPRAMQGARKTWGNDGMGAITGTFRSEALGKFEVIATDLGRTVVLQWSDHRLVVSPGDPEKFAENVRAMAGLRH
ncbi:MAG: hypothetical protein KA257_02855 [Opitutaceae bacterium]|nr:hypothetical protein [Opitutaceae bacterium]MBP9912907.1 hypothetical protein [Opitutaceae bacterium]